jgi:hypothetical protein
MRHLAFAIIAALLGIVVGALIGEPLPGLALGLGMLLGAAGSILVVPALRGAPAGVLGGAIADADAGWSEFHRELARARRFDGQFVLVRFPVLSVSEPAALAAIRDELAVRGRRIDRLWIDESNILILLPETSKAAAETVLARIRAGTSALAAIEPALAAFPEQGITSGTLISAVYGSGSSDVPTPIGALRPEPRVTVTEPTAFEADASLDDLAAQRG